MYPKIFALLYMIGGAITACSYLVYKKKQYMKQERMITTEEISASGFVAMFWIVAVGTYLLMKAADKFDQKVMPHVNRWMERAIQKWG